MTYSEIKEILKTLHQDGWSKRPGWGYSKIWSKEDSHYRHEMFFHELQRYIELMPLDEVLLRLDTEARRKLDEYHETRKPRQFVLKGD